MTTILERSRAGRLFSLAIGLAIVILVAALTHFVSILLIPKVATQNVYGLLPAHDVNHMIALPPSRPGDRLVPYRDPAAVQGLCFFDVAKGPVRVRTHTEVGQLLTLSFRTPKGQVFYSMTDRAAFHDMIDIRLVTADQLAAIEDEDTDSGQDMSSELRLKVPVLRGIMVATTLVERPGEQASAERRIETITCASEPLPPPS